MLGRIPSNLQKTSGSMPGRLAVRYGARIHFGPSNQGEWALFEMDQEKKPHNKLRGIFLKSLLAGSVSE
jgi:hypothetical protein